MKREAWSSDASPHKDKSLNDSDFEERQAMTQPIHPNHHAHATDLG